MPKPPHVVEGQEIFLHAHDMPEKIRVFTWFKGNNTDEGSRIMWVVLHDISTLVGPHFDGRQIVYINGSLSIHPVKKKDEGFYILTVDTHDNGTHKASTEFGVHSK